MDSFTQGLQNMGWFFDDYRTRADIQVIPTSNLFQNYATPIGDRPLPLPGRPRLARVQPLTWERSPIRRPRRPRQLLGPVPANASDRFLRVRDRFQTIRNYFTVNYQNLAFRAVLGWGGNGLALRYRYRPPGQQSSTQFVLKASVWEWDSYGIRYEYERTRYMARAAHCVQMLDRTTLGLPPWTPFQYDHVEDDDSSEPSTSSGEESCGNVPTAKARIRQTRRQIIASNQARQDAKDRAFNQRIEARQAEMEVRENLLEILRRRLTDPNPPPPPPNTHDLYRKDFLVLEYSGNGDLMNLIYRLNEKNEMVPNRILWGFWLCLVRAIVNMEYPVRKFHPRRRDAPPPKVNGQPAVDNTELGKRVGEELYEEIPPPRRRWARKRFVHFDIDPSNVFIDNIDINANDDEHRIIPKLKMADFGLAKIIRPRKINLFYTRQRAQGKFGYYAPEQFGLEWDYLRQRNGDPIAELGPEISEEKIAGNYGSHTNVWGIALTLWQLITKLQPPVPPALQSTGGIRQHYCALLLTDPEYAYIDLELRQTLARCMSHAPSNRPTCRVLLQQALQGIRKVFPAENDAFIKDWVAKYVYGP